MKSLSKILTICLYLVVTIVLVAAIGSNITKKPLLITAIRSNSMYPLLERGDMVFIKQASPDIPIKKGDIIAFTTETGNYASQGLIMHRIVGGTTKEGFITKGDANEKTDQGSGGTGRIKREWIVSKAITFGKQPVKLPLIGYLPLWLEELNTKPSLLPTIALVLAAVIGVSELLDGRKKKHKKSKLELQLIYFFGGLTITIMLAASMLATSQHLNIIYEVSESSQGVLMGSNVGILKVDEKADRPLTDLNNKGFFPIITTITSSDKQFSFSHAKLRLKPGDQIKTSMTVNAETPGKYQSTVWVGMFFPLLPENIIYWLSQKSYWLALIIISLLPGLPIMLYPLVESRMRRKTIKEIRRKTRRIKRLIPLGFN